MAGIRRETLSRWLHGNPVFIAKLNEKKNEARHEGIACINSIVVQSVTALGGALRHPDINPTAVVQSIMSMLPKMYAIMLEQGDAETASRNIMLNLLCKQSMAQDALYFDNPEEAEVMLKQYIDAHEAEMEYEQAVDREGVPQELVEHLHDKLNKVVEKLKPVVGKRK
jgi:hypothetical protein